MAKDETWLPMVGKVPSQKGQTTEPPRDAGVAGLDIALADAPAEARGD